MGQEEDKTRQLETEKEERFQQLISDKASALKQIYKLQSEIADLDQAIADIAGADRSVMAYW